jgi:hypothetical protein
MKPYWDLSDGHAGAAKMKPGTPTKAKYPALFPPEQPFPTVKVRRKSIENASAIIS